jgi:phage terminase large subunit
MLVLKLKLNINTQLFVIESMQLIARLKDSKGERHIFVSQSCKTLIKGLQRQIYKENTNIPDKEDGFDHMNDALGYMIDYLKPLTTQANFNSPTRWTMK